MNNKTMQLSGSSSTPVARITNLRALAIMLVVFGHSIIIYSNAWGLYKSAYHVPLLDNIKNAINYVQMPLFFSLSGYLFFQKHDHNFKKIVVTKARRLLLPYFVIGILWLIPIRILVNYQPYSNRTVYDLIWNCLVHGYDNGHLWYLPCLFICFLVAFVVRRILGNKICTMFSVLFCFIAAIILFFCKNLLNDANLINFCTYFVWFCYGGVEATVFATAARPWCRTMELMALAAIYAVLTPVRPLVVSTVLLVALYLIVPNKENTVANIISKNSFGIYLFHSPLVYITFTLFSNAHPVFVCFLNFVVFGCVAWGMTLLMRKWKLNWIIGELRGCVHR